MKVAGLVLVLASAVLSGCVSNDGAQDDAPAVHDPTGCLDVGCSVAGDLGVGTPEEEPAGPTLETAPVWRLGEWWRYRVTDGFTGSVYEATRVVAGVEGDFYLVGMPANEFSNELLVLHMPGFGQVARSNLSFEIHDVLYAPLRFPLQEGAAWKTAFEGRPVNATVLATEGATATIELVGPSDGGAAAQLLGSSPDHQVITFDAAVGEMTRNVADGYATVEIVDHGYGFEGIVTVPHMHDVIFQHGRLAGVAWSGDPQPVPTETVEVDTTYDRVSFVIILGDAVSFLAPAAPTPPAGLGVYREKVTAPDGKVYEAQKTPDEGPRLELAFFMHEKPGGTWTFEHVAAGPGLAMSEGIAYHVYDVDLPSGRILPSKGEHPHGG